MPDNIQATDEFSEFVMSFVDESEKRRAPFEEVWDEVEANFLVRPVGNPASQSTKYPFLTASDRYNDASMLMDPETHHAVMTLVAELALSMVGETGYVATRGVGFEDVFRSGLVNRLLEYDFSLPGHFMSFVQWLLSSGVLGTGMLEAGWQYTEEPRTVQELILNPYTMMEERSEFVVPVTVYDDPKIKYLALRDFFPDHGATNTADMQGAAKRFSMTADEALDMARRGIFKMSAVKEAIKCAARDAYSRKGQANADDLTGTEFPISPPRFYPIIGYEYYGTVPMHTDDEASELSSSDGMRRRVITCLGGQIVRNEPWPRRVPFFECKIIPRFDSFYGVSPAEVMRYDQDFATVLKRMMADAVVRSVHAQPIVDRNAGVDLAKLRRFRPDVPIMTDRPETAVQFLDYTPPIQYGFQMYAGVKANMRHSSGAVDVLQGLGLGTKRASASEFVGTIEQARGRPQLYARIVESEYLPPLGKYLLDLNKEFLEPGDGLSKRVGESQMPVSLADISSEFDVRFVGSSRETNRMEKVAAFREIAAAAASNPVILMSVPWIPLLRKWFDGLGAHEIAAMVGNEELTQINILLTQIAGPQGMLGNNNGEQKAKNPLGILPAQAAGTAQ